MFFIFNLLFATWLVFKIEEISPSDFGRFKSLFDDPPGSISTRKKNLKKIIVEYKKGTLDSAQLDQKIEKYLENNGKIQ